MSLEIRKLETEWINLKDKETTSGAAGDAAAAAAATPAAGSSTHKKRYEIKLNGYGKSNKLLFNSKQLLHQYFESLWSYC